MNFDIQHRPSYALAIVSLDAGETVVVPQRAITMEVTQPFVPLPGVRCQSFKIFGIVSQEFG